MTPLKIQAYLDPAHAGSDDPAEVPWTEAFLPSEMRKNRPSWYRELSRLVRGTATRTLKFCPSYINLLGHGFVVRNQADFSVSTEGEEVETVSAHPLSKGHHLNGHPTEQFGAGYPFPRGFLPAAVKLASPYRLRAERAVSMMILPCWWTPESADIQALHGLITLPGDTDLGYHINTFVRRPEPGETITIPREAPIAHLFFVDVLDAEVTIDQGLAGTKRAQSTRVVAALGRSSLLTPMERISRYLLQRRKGDSA